MAFVTSLFVASVKILSCIYGSIFVLLDFTFEKRDFNLFSEDSVLDVSCSVITFFAFFVSFVFFLMFSFLSGVLPDLNFEKKFFVFNFNSRNLDVFCFL